MTPRDTLRLHLYDTRSALSRKESSVNLYASGFSIMYSKLAQSCTAR